MSSGSYFPPPVKQVEIPKATGGIRKLGVPTVADRVGQTAVKLLIEPILDPCSMRIGMDTGPGDRPNRR
jgi:retron-type reverse transcriptase